MGDLAASALRLRSSYAGSDSLPSTGANCISPTETWWKNGRTSAITKWNLPIPIINSQKRGEMGGSPATVSIKQCRSHPTSANCISSGRVVFNIQHVTKETVMKLECATSAYVHIIYIYTCMHAYIHTYILLYMLWYTWIGNGPSQFLSVLIVVGQSEFSIDRFDSQGVSIQKPFGYLIWNFMSFINPILATAKNAASKESFESDHMHSA